MSNLPTRAPLVTHCRCCGNPLFMQWQQALIASRGGMYQIECKTAVPKCLLFEVTTTDTAYIQTTDAWLK